MVCLKEMVRPHEVRAVDGWQSAGLSITMRMPTAALRGYKDSTKTCAA
jgi:hypothetical protein